jgi:hypothetical protein
VDDTLHDAALADLRDHDARLRTMIDQQKTGTGYIATSNDGRPAGPSDEDLQRLERRADASHADIEDMQKDS